MKEQVFVRDDRVLPVTTVTESKYTFHDSNEDNDSDKTEVAVEERKPRKEKDSQKETLEYQ